MKILTFTTLYPNNMQPHNGIFVETRIKNLLKDTDIESTVVAPVPWFPLKGSMFGDYAKYAGVCKSETRHNIEVFHPRYLVIPKIGMLITPFFLALSSYFAVRKLIKQGYQFDLIDAHYFYPDGIAAIILGKVFEKPVVVTARGTDINLIPAYTIPRKLIQWVTRKAAHMVTVCEALRQELIKLGAEPDKVTTLRNGVDLELFQPADDRDALRKALGISGHSILSVGHLIERKGHHLVIDAIKNIPDVTLYIAGNGPEEAALKKLAKELSLESRVVFLGPLTQGRLRDYYAAADALVLASSREGWANVLLEAMACGTPVVATNIWGTPEVVQNDKVGFLAERSAKSIETGISHLHDQPLDRAYIREYANGFNWLETSIGQERIFSSLVFKNTYARK